MTRYFLSLKWKNKNKTTWRFTCLPASYWTTENNMFSYTLYLFIHTPSFIFSSSLHEQYHYNFQSFMLNSMDMDGLKLLLLSASRIVTQLRYHFEMKPNIQNRFRFARSTNHIPTQNPHFLEGFPD